MQFFSLIAGMALLHIANGILRAKNFKEDVLQTVSDEEDDLSSSHSNSLYNPSTAVIA
jgi:hypothetical protein